MWSALLTTSLDIATRALIVREHGVDAAGLYQAAWALSGVFAGFILGAMGTDFYPRLTAAIRDPEKATRLVNEQTEIGILLALPGLLATLALGPLLVRVLYSAEFLPAAELLPWLLTGVFLRVFSWPLGFIQLAKGAGRLFAATETAFIGLQLGLVYWLVPAYGIVGAAYAFALVYVLYTAAMLLVARVLIRFQWSLGVMRLLLASAVFWGVAVALAATTTGWQGTALGALLAAASSLLVLRGLSSRLGSQPRWLRRLGQSPAGRWLLRQVRVV
jgi:PST family polysaccharide transporter